MRSWVRVLVRPYSSGCRSVSWFQLDQLKRKKTPMTIRAMRKMSSVSPGRDIGPLRATDDEGKKERQLRLGAGTGAAGAFRVAASESEAAGVTLSFGSGAEV